MTSAKVVALVKRKLNLDKSTKIGHMGTLDMLASGVLPIAIGHATRLFNLMLSKRKYYRAEFTFGYMTDTLDNDGKVVSTSDRIPSKVEIEAVLPQFLGEIHQIPPLYSAKHINGKRAYELAREGVEFALKECEMQIFEIKLLSYAHPFVSFRVKVSEGAYIRSLGELIAKKLGVCGALSALRRVSEGSVCVGREEIRELDPLSHIALPRVELGELYQEFYDGKKITLKNQKLRVNTPYLVVFEEFFSIIELNENGEVKYRLNRIPKC